MGLVTNGTLLNHIPIEFNKLTWVRISMGDGKEVPTNFWTNLEIIVNKYKTDWSFSYVLTPTPDYDLINEVIKFGNKYNFTHIRLVTDILETKDMTTTIDLIKAHLKRIETSDALVIYQNRTEYTPGTSKCKISLLKPVINADGNVFPCCGVQ